MSQKLTRFFDMEELLPQALHHGLPWWLSIRESACQYRRPGFDPWVGKIPWSREWQPTSVFLPGESHGQKSLAGYSPWDRKESYTTEQLTHTHTHTHTHTSSCGNRQLVTVHRKVSTECECLGTFYNDPIIHSIPVSNQGRQLLNKSIS